MSEISSPEPANPADDIVVTAKPARKEWGYDIAQMEFNTPGAPETRNKVASYHIDDKNAKLDLPSQAGWIEGTIPQDASLKLTGARDRSNFMTVGVEAGGELKLNGGGGNDYIKPSIIPVANAEQLNQYKPGQVSVDGGYGRDVVAVPGDTIITRLADDKKGEHYRFTDRNGYSFDTTGVENVVNTTPQPKEAVTESVKRNGPELPAARVPGTELNTLRLDPGHSMTVQEATRPLYDMRIPKYEAATEAASNDYSNKLAACLADKGDLNLCKDIKYTPPSVSDFGQDPKRNEYTGQLPTPKILTAENSKTSAAR